MREFHKVRKAEIEQAKSRDMLEIKRRGEKYPIFNTCDHHLIDMSDLRVKKEDWMQTISVKLPNDTSVTLCVMQPSDDQACVDVEFYGNNIQKTSAIGMKDGKMNKIDNMNLYSVIAFENIEEKTNK